VGGVQYVGDKASNRLPINLVEVINIDNLMQHTFVIEKIVLDLPLNDVVYLSSCDATIIGKDMFVFGGLPQKPPGIDHDRFDEPSDAMYTIDLENNSIVSNYGKEPALHSSGGTLLTLADDLVLIAGGTSAQFSIFTSRCVELAKCAMDEECKINDAVNQEEEVQWIGCDRCKEWFHLCCVGLVQIPTDKHYSCPHCAS
jgi:hypothetical protein